MTIKKIFFSYSRADGSEFALRLALDLKRKGFDVWIDQEDIRAGSEWDIEIEKALETCDCLLFIETEKSVASNNVLDEVYYALEQHKKVIPLILVDSKTPFRLQRLQHIDFTKGYDPGFSLLTTELENGSAGVTYVQEESKSITKVEKPFLAKYARQLMMVAGLILVIAGVFFFTSKGKSNLSTKVANASDSVSGNLTSLTGEWTLTEVESKAEGKRGYLKIESIDGEKVAIKSYVQFYYPKTNDTSYLVVFNGFSGCASCILEKDMKLTPEDIAIGSRFIKVANGTEATGKKPGDTVMDANSNKSISASVRLLFKDDKTATISVQQPAVTELSHGLVIQPFTYTFKFKKSD